MKILYLLYLLKINMFQVIVNNSRTESLSTVYIHSSLFDSTSCTEEPEFPDPAIMVNITDTPII